MMQPKFQYVGDHRLREKQNSYYGTFLYMLNNYCRGYTLARVYLNNDLVEGSLILWAEHGPFHKFFSRIAPHNPRPLVLSFSIDPP